MADHSVLSPSAAARWLRCPGSVGMPQQPRRDTRYTTEGTLAHFFCQELLTAAGGVSAPVSDDERRAMAALEPEFDTAEMRRHAAAYRDYVMHRVRALAAARGTAGLWVELRLSMDEWAPGCFGTSDAVIAAPGELHVIDYKYGTGHRVEPYLNPQLMLYALGALSHLGDDYDARRVVMTIVQPRLDHIDSATMSTDELLAWGESEVRPAAAEALLPRGEATRTPGVWCRWCPAIGCGAIGMSDSRFRHSLNDF